MSSNETRWINIESPFSWSHKWKCEAANENPVSTICDGNGSFKKTIPNPVEETLSNEPSQKLPRIPTRIVFVVLGFFGLFNCYTMRINLNVAMVAMVGPPEESHIPFSNETTQTCSELIQNKYMGNSSIPIQEGEFDWDSRVQHFILASFYIFYMSFQIPMGIISERYHSKHFFGFGVLITAIFTLLTPLAARHSVTALVVARAIQGLGQAATWPAMNALIGRWVPVMERSRSSSFIYNGCAVGIFVGFAFSGLLCDSSFLGGWPSVFYVFGAFGCIWFILWTLLVSESPEVHPYITKAALILIRKGQERLSAKTNVPWKAILTSVPVWGLVIVHIGQDWAYHTLLTETPIYLNNVLHLDLKQNGLLSALPNAVSAVTACFASIFADKFRQKNLFHINTIRKIFNSIGMYLPGIFIFLMAFTGCSPILVVVLLSLTMGVNGFVFSGLFSTHVDMSPEYAGTLMAITNSFGNIPGFLAPIFVGWIIKDGNTLENWGIVFITSALFLVICGTIYNIFCSAEQQNWHSESDDETKASYISVWPRRKFSIVVN